MLLPCLRFGNSIAPCLTNHVDIHVVRSARAVHGFSRWGLWFADMNATGVYEIANLNEEGSPRGFVGVDFLFALGSIMQG